MEMGRGGLVAYVEAELERDIALGRLPRCGQFGSEATLARRHNVCRGTIREALRRLAARGLVVQRPGRRTRAVALDESLTLENLGLALHDARSPEARRLLEGYFSLRRQVMVELLVDCCAKASQGDLNQLSQVCFGLWDAGKWESGERCAQVEFELLRLAARVAERPGHVLLVQSLQRAFLGAAARLLPFMGGDALREWAIRAMNALSERDVRALQQELPTLMAVCDERVLEQFAPVPMKPVSLEPHRDESGALDGCASAIPQGDVMEARLCGATCSPDRVVPTSEHDGVLRELPDREAHGLELTIRELEELAPIPEQGGALDECLGGDARHMGGPTAAVARSEGLEPACCIHGVPRLVEQYRGAGLSPTSAGAVPFESAEELSGDSMPGALGNLSGCRTGPGTSCPAERLPSVTPPRGSWEFPRAAVPEDGEPLHDIQGALRWWTARLWRFTARCLGLAAS
ncbi:FadR/GntR family transcriptional regulator [Corallococcus sp. EGB]|uniref:FadR/GntR family transcriptional regulator n=1 Tax=Corallococcus sp. EGB TaxID=1521117 RepID=UPI001CBD06A6|nr:GntR family transcriptional regulator [Corallococcus sp. EGB]